MATSAYQLWLKKREFKAPHPPPGTATTSTAAISRTTSKESRQGASNPSQGPSERTQTHSSKFHAVSGAETTQVTVKSIARPPATKKRARSWLSSGGEAADEQKPLKSKVAGVDYVAENKVAGSKRVRTSKELMNATVIKLASSAKVLRQSSAKRDVERAEWTGRIDREPKVAARVDSDASAAMRVKSSSLKHSVGTNRNEVDKYRRSAKGAGRNGADGTQNVEQPRDLRSLKELEERQRDLDEKASGDNTMKRLRFDGIRDESEPSGLPLKSPLKLRKIRTAMLDESQYWMAVDRFSHLT
ncbi:hypothetical protein P3T76_011583 [Phytophthora citrophthora]|uniref:Uncharacterized protein n=1 Tax=Phytophthora citrophthora TaxID=4793 RepID=A0AAD9G8L5_9STRA|nr:hypothetical protein P3T76_011583 [Phytophthora citrophthora]